MPQPATCPKCSGHMEPEGREPMPVKTFRCDGCGYRESFARAGA